MQGEGFVDVDFAPLFGQKERGTVFDLVPEGNVQRFKIVAVLCLETCDVRVDKETQNSQLTTDGCFVDWTFQSVNMAVLLK